MLRVVSHDWEQHELGAAIARRLRLPRNSLEWAGTKDRRAVAERLASYRGLPPAEPLDLPRVEVVEVYRARDGLVLGHHYGNSFDIRIDELLLPPADAVRAFRTIEAELRAAGGLPNFFGPQRFGEVRPITHEVGRWVVRGDIARAVDVYLVDRRRRGRKGSETRRAGPTRSITTRPGPPGVPARVPGSNVPCSSISHAAILRSGRSAPYLATFASSLSTPSRLTCSIAG